MSTAHNSKHDYYIGLMSGTSMDGVDGVVADLAGGLCKVIAHHSLPFSNELRDEMLALNSAGADELHRAAIAANQLVALYAQVVAGLLYTAELESSDITAIGAHGQTVRHRPDLGYTWQINNPALLAERTGMTVVADFRSRDVAAGGQGAPLVPAFHKAVFGRAGDDEDVAILNIGGIANLSLLSADGSVVGFDTGPGNVLMDAWIAKHLNKAYDADGQWAASGSVLQGLLDVALQDSYFAKPYPKSTGRDDFNLTCWLKEKIELAKLNASNAALQDVQATLLEITARSIASAIPPSCTCLFVCGGGALNTLLMRRLQELLPKVLVQSTETLGIPPMQVEAAAFAWLASKCVAGEKLDMQKITGSRGARIYGAIYKG